MIIFNMIEGLNYRSDEEWSN